MQHKADPDLAIQLAMTPSEMQLLDWLVKDNAKTLAVAPLTRYVNKLAQLGGYMACNSDIPPANTVIWQGLRRLSNIQVGFELANNCG